MAYRGYQLTDMSLYELSALTDKQNLLMNNINGKFTARVCFPICTKTSRNNVRVPITFTTLNKLF